MMDVKTNCEGNVKACFQLFIREGLRAVSIDDIVRNCNLSKKDLYDKFGNKEGVIREVFEYDTNNMQTLFATAQADSDNAIEEMVHVHQHFIKQLSNVSPVLFFDLRKYYTEIGQDFFKKKMELSKQFALKNIQRGVEEGIYREDVDREIVATLWIAEMDMIREQKWFPLHEFDIQRLIRGFAQLHLRSIANENGIKIINQFFQKHSI